MKAISKRTIQRSSIYLNYLLNDPKSDIEYVSSADIARDLNMKLVNVRIDIGHLSSIKGTPRKGFIKGKLIEDLKKYQEDIEK